MAALRTANERSSSTTRFLLSLSIILVITVALTARAAAQTTDTRELEAYAQAISQPRGAVRSAALQKFVAASALSSLRMDALAFLVWDNLSAGDRQAATRWASELANAEPGNALAFAVLVDAGEQSGAYDAGAGHALTNLRSLRKPVGMASAEFQQLQQQVTAILCAAIGTAELQRDDTVRAREYLRRAVALAPNDARYAYQLGLADLAGKDRDAAEGYWYLARAANLARGTPAGQQIDEFTRRKYQEDGGNSADWDRFLAAATVPTRSAAPAAALAASGTASTQPSVSNAPAVATASAGAPGGSRRSDRGSHNAHVKRAKADIPRIPAPPPLPPDIMPTRDDTGIAISEAGLPAPEAAPQPFRAGAPISLGILVEASLANPASRQAVIYSLIDLCRRLAANARNEAFILSFSDRLVFDQDLTGSGPLLENALEQIKPQSGAALLDAVAFSAFHLNRIAKQGNNRVLFVISDGGNLDSRMPASAATAQLSNGVRVFCVGLDVTGTDGMSRLRALASRTGGEASFIVDATQFRGAAQQLAAKMGIDFSY